MKTIKFRAWDVDDKQMIFFDIPTIIKYASSLPEIPENARARKDYCEAIMQYTGLKDKNGKEIYEGDIITWGANEEEKATIKWGGKNKCGFVMERKDLYKPLLTVYSTTEVIGNIYENNNE